MAHYEDQQTNWTAVMRFDWGGAELVPAAGLEGPVSSTGPLALADLDGDGKLDLFVGGRLQAGRYPEPGSSGIWLNRGGKWVPDESSKTNLAGLGLVTAAIFTDLDGDGYGDLVVTCEWGPVHVFRN